MNRPALPSTYVAFSGGVPLYAGEDDDAAGTREIEIALSGQYKTRDFSLTSKEFDQIIRNHADSGVDPAVDREHESWFSLTPGAAHGWVKSLDVRPAERDKRRSALVAKVELTDLGHHAVKNKHFRYVSMGYDRAGKHRMTGEPIGAILDHLALVKRPFIEGMRPISLSLSAQLGRPVEDGELNMDELAKQLRSWLGLAADAPEEAIVAALAKRREADAATASATAEQLSALQARAGQLDALSSEVTALKDERWAATVDLAAKEYRCTPDEAKRYKALKGEARQTIAEDLAHRERRKPAGEDVGAALTGSGGDRAAADGDKGNPLALTSAQREALRKYEAEHPGMAPDDALVACVEANPALFPPPVHSHAEGR